MSGLQIGYTSCPFMIVQISNSILASMDPSLATFDPIASAMMDYTLFLAYPDIHILRIDIHSPFPHSPSVYRDHDHDHDSYLLAHQLPASIPPCSRFPVQRTSVQILFCAVRVLQCDQE
ncbi:hypothetical protein GYMLUDRAFT_783283 [Collybiopsis luxurians FD-317 M1]|uniref:Uncharacterized protein n=1 Tax=Collybiopsis luxurians FD-317 M1 TaxID=944289 RepID=A0A0D0C2P0_9AGAR|nr:hypothetical protein GYMLUDRAFT_783283 [Collybiopsis luxurians FD-317 M1]